MKQTVRLVRIIEEDAVDLRAGAHGLACEFRQRLRFAILRRLAGEQFGQILVGRDQRFRLLRHIRLLHHIPPHYSERSHHTIFTYLTMTHETLPGVSWHPPNSIYRWPSGPHAVHSGNPEPFGSPVAAKFTQYRFIAWDKS